MTEIEFLKRMNELQAEQIEALQLRLTAVIVERDRTRQAMNILKSAPGNALPTGNPFRDDKVPASATSPLFPEDFPELTEKVG